MRCVSAPSDVTEVATHPRIVRRALPSEVDEFQVRTTQLQNAFHRLTPELSRPVAGRRPRASVANSTWPTPRHGVGLNELLGAYHNSAAIMRNSDCAYAVKYKGR